MNRLACWTPSFALALVAALVVSVSPEIAHAQSSCTVDVDCTEAGTACGTDVCTYSTSSGGAIECAPPAQSKGSCFVDSDCKCDAVGATCVGAVSGEPLQNGHCSFTSPDGGGSTTADAGSEAGLVLDSGAAVDSGSGPSGSSSGSSSGAGNGGTSDSGAGSAADGGGTGSSSGGGGGSGGGSGGCAVNARDPGQVGAGFALFAAVAGLIGLRRRARAAASDAH